MSYLYIKTKKSYEECRRDLQDRVGTADWRWDIELFSIGLRRHFDEEFCGTVGPDGFDVAETGPGGWGIRHPRIRGQWAESGEWTVIRLQPYLKWYAWIGPTMGGVFFGLVATLVALFIRGSMSAWTAVVVLLSLCACCAAFRVTLHAREMSSRGRVLSRKLADLFEAELIDEAEGGQVELEFITRGFQS